MLDFCRILLIKHFLYKKYMNHYCKCEINCLFTLLVQFSSAHPTKPHTSYKSYSEGRFQISGYTHFGKQQLHERILTQHNFL